MPVTLQPDAAFSHRRSRGILAAFALANAGGVIAYLPLLTLLLPIKVEALAGEARIALFTATVCAGAVAASLSNILFGWLSDRSVRRGGGRRPWMIGGAGATAASYAVIAAAATPATLLAAIVLFQIAVNALLAPMMAVLAEEVPDAQKGTAGGLIALGSPIASGMSALLLGGSIVGEGARLAVLAGVIALAILPLALIPARRAVAAAPAGDGDRPASRDLAVAGVARLLVQVAGVVTQTYLFYYFETIVPAADQPGLPIRIGHLMTIAYILPLPVALLLGRVSDLTRRRKPILLLAAAVATAGLLGMAAARNWSGGAAAYALYVAGSSVFVALHAALAMQLLPDPRHRGRDLGLLNLANTVPSLLGAPLAWAFATPHDFTGVMLVLALLTALGGAAMTGVRGWR